MTRTNAFPQHFAFPFRFDGSGRTAGATHAEHVRDLIEQVLFTSPGERVMRPDFGCGLLDQVFAPGGPELVAALELSIAAALQRWMGDLIDVAGLDIDLETEATVRVHLTYTIRRTGEAREDEFTRTGER